MKGLKSATALCCAALFACVGAGCQTQPTYQTVKKQITTAVGVDFMNTPANLVLTANMNDASVYRQALALAEDCQSQLTAIEGSLSTTVNSSAVSRFNAAEAGATVQIDEIAYNVLSLALEYYEQTNGYYNPAVAYSVDLYGFGARYQNGWLLDENPRPYDRQTPYQTLPDERYVTAFQTLAQSFGNVVLQQNEQGYFVTKPTQTVEVAGVTYSLTIDLGGLGKGYATDKIGALMQEYGFLYGYFSFGTSSVAVKQSRVTEDGAWDLGLRNPRGYNYYAQVDAKDICLSTSGDYEQYYAIEGKRYSHLINPFTGMPIDTGISSVTVLGGTAAEADALTTALCAMELATAVDFINTKLKNKFVCLTYQTEQSGAIVSNAPARVKITDTAYTLGNGLDGEGNIVLHSYVAP